MQPSIQKAVIPAAGKGRRMSPISDYLPKSMLPLGKKPVLHHIIEELRDASISKIAVIARSNQTAVFSYFMNFPEVEFIIDDSTSGPGGAILEAREFVGENDFITIFADAPVRGADRGIYLQELMDIKKNKDAEAALAIYKVAQKEMGSRGVITFKDKDHQKEGIRHLADIIEKPEPEKYTSSWAAACRYVLSPQIFEALGNIERDENEELQLTTALRHLIKEGNSVVGYSIPNNMRRYDTGNFEGYFEAFRDFADLATD